MRTSPFYRSQFRQGASHPISASGEESEFKARWAQSRQHLQALFKGLCVLIVSSCDCRRVTKDYEEDQQRLPSDYEALLDPQEAMIRDQEYLQHSSLWGHQYVAGKSLPALYYSFPFES